MKEKIFCLGPEKSYTDLAMGKWIKESKRKEVEICYQKQIGNVFDEFQHCKVNGIPAIGIVPFENSVEGTVNSTIDELFEFNGVIIGEVILDVRHNLLTIEKAELQDIKIIYSHPQALAQVRKWIQKNCPWAELMEENSTSRAAEIVKGKNNPEIAAIASKEAATIFELKVLREEINDSANNSTRFIVIGQDISFFSSEKDFKTSLTFTVKNESGALLKVLEVFDVFNINMTKLESRPTKEELGSYRFFVDIEGHQQEKKVAPALELLKEKILMLKILGSYPIWEEPDK